MKAIPNRKAREAALLALQAEAAEVEALWAKADEPEVRTEDARNWADLDLDDTPAIIWAEHYEEGVEV